MSNDNKRTYADIERVGVIVKFKDDPNTISKKGRVRYG